MMPVLQLGPLAIQVPGLVILAGLWLGLTLSERNAARFGVKSNELYNLVLVAIIAGIAGARLAYIFRYPTAFGKNIINVLSLNPGLLDPIAGLVIGLLASLAYGQRKKMPLWPTLDALTPLLAVFMLAFAISHLASGAAFGAPSNLPWSINLWGARRHPAQIYETLFALIILIIVWPGRSRSFGCIPGVYFLSFIALSAAARLFLEAFRGDSIIILSGLRLAQMAAWGILALSLFAIYWRRKSVYNDYQ